MEFDSRNWEMNLSFSPRYNFCMNTNINLSGGFTTSIILTILFGIACLSPAIAAQDSPANIATFSVVAFDPATGEVGVAVQSRFFAVGTVVPWARAGVGAVASQAFGNPTYGPRGLDLMAAGADPEEVLAILLRDDPEAARRQVGVVSSHEGGEAATYTGEECMDWAGGITGVSYDGIVYSVQGNILTGPEVAEALSQAMYDGEVGPEVVLTAGQARALAHRDLAGRMLAALLSGQAAGGDSRGMQSAALIVCQAGMGYGGYTDVKYNLRVDDAADPFDELARLLNLARPFSLVTEGYNYAYAGDFDRAFATFDYLLQLDPEDLTHHYHYACALSLAGDPKAALEHLAIALEFDPMMKAHAAEDPDLTALYELDEFRELVGE